MSKRALANDDDFPALPQCAACRHRLPIVPSGPRCKAFPDGIPEIMLRGDFDHRKPYPGDNGITFEPKPGYKHPEEARLDLPDVTPQDE